MTSATVRTARLVRKVGKDAPSPPSHPGRSFDLVCDDARRTLHNDVELRRLEDGTWRATLTIGGEPDIRGASACDGPDERAALLRLADWARRAAEGLALITSDGATVTTEVVEISARAPEAE